MIIQRTEFGDNLSANVYKCIQNQRKNAKFHVGNGIFLCINMQWFIKSRICILYYCIKSLYIAYIAYGRMRNLYIYIYTYTCVCVSVSMSYFCIDSIFQFMFLCKSGVIFRNQGLKCCKRLLSSPLYIVDIY